jgi:murein DD-endopeptidase MepM/ murein hydrolase activator NlpD
MDRYSVIVVADPTAPVRRFEIRKDLFKRGIYGVGMAAVLLTLCLGDYVRVRIAHSELNRLRAESAEQKEQIRSFSATLSGVKSKLDNISEFERKVRIIANLPGSAATGGEEVVEVGPETPPLESQLDGVEIPVPTEAEVPETPAVEQPPAEADAEADPEEPSFESLQLDAQHLGEVASSQERSLAEVTDQLESKRAHLASTPAIWPTKGWLTSRFGSRISPFTNRKQFHAGIDIAGQRGTDVISPARGKVVYAGSRGPLGKSLIIDHGYGVRTLYGHGDDLYVKNGDHVERGQRIAALGSTGRSTGPHLHYVVEVEGKAVNPLDYIFD